MGDTRDFGPSLSRCRSLTSFYTHKVRGGGEEEASLPRIPLRLGRLQGRYLHLIPRRCMSRVCLQFWGLGDVRHFVSLPRCTEATFWRSDDLDSLDIFAPALTDLDLRVSQSTSGSC